VKEGDAAAAAREGGSRHRGSVGREGTAAIARERRSRHWGLVDMEGVAGSVVGGWAPPPPRLIPQGGSHHLHCGRMGAAATALGGRAPPPVCERRGTGHGRAREGSPGVVVRDGRSGRGVVCETREWEGSQL
jgi:hypothetical protein